MKYIQAIQKRENYDSVIARVLWSLQQCWHEKFWLPGPHILTTLNFASWILHSGSKSFYVGVEVLQRLFWDLKLANTVTELLSQYSWRKKKSVPIRTGAGQCCDPAPPRLLFLWAKLFWTLLWASVRWTATLTAHASSANPGFCCLRCTSHWFFNLCFISVSCLVTTPRKDSYAWFCFFKEIMILSETNNVFPFTKVKPIIQQ